MDIMSKEERSRRMSLIRSKWTGQERLLHNRLKVCKVRHEMHPRITGNPDVLVHGKNLAIFLHGCFWHKCPKCYREPKSNRDYWIPKIQGNVERDKKNRKLLESKGYEVLEVWQDCGKDTKMSEPRTKERIKELKQFIKKAKLKKQGCLKNELEWFKQNTGKIVISRELAQIPGREGFPISHNVRRVVELRDEQGYDIVNHKSNEKLGLDLKVDEWILLTKDPDPKKIRSRGVNKRIMFDVFTRDNSQCQFCGRTKDDDDPFKSGHKIKLHVGHIIAHKRKEGSDFVKVEKIKDMKADKKLTPKDIITMCNVCNEGAKNKDLKILNPVEKVLALNEETQKSIFNALKKKFS